ncbi:PiggyBac transposable element-derived protein 4-like [Plakobranchus ocellatus]|uniref:PiggyBac transposable element-derived protein 4-like n=1 Tax=Plakobranchus ocellatus TaxID=259542 RepID=A0AAV4AIL3_9GAST|nr:PiggyBac transposable element-derived protein 4-like [Plakobranchus ocellatus]
MFRPPHTPEPMSHFLFHLDIARSLLSGGTVMDRPVGEVQAIAGMATPGTSREHRRVRLPGRKKQCVQCRVKDVRTATNKCPETVLGCFLCRTHLCDEQCFAQFHHSL